MSKAKISVSLDTGLLLFVNHYQSNHNAANRSEVIEEAISLLREKELEAAYLESNKELDLELDNWCADGLDEKR